MCFENLPVGLKSLNVLLRLCWICTTSKKQEKLGNITWSTNTGRPFALLLTKQDTKGRTSPDREAWILIKQDLVWKLQFLKFRGGTLRGEQPSVRLSEEICLSEGSAKICLSEGSAGSLRGCFGRPSCCFSHTKRPKHLLKKSYSKRLRRTQIRWVIWRSSSGFRKGCCRNSCFLSQ